ncbi:MAG: hypothetical protein AMXMBFR84_35800 [Candidatus Hydrogenedentota bacterium]
MSAFSDLSNGYVEQWDFRHYRTPETLGDDRITDIEESGDGSIWVATWGSGLSHLRGTEWTQYNTSNGLPGDWLRCLLADPDGSMWIGTADGLAHIRDGVVTAYTSATIPELYDNSIRSMIRLESGALWLSIQEHHIVQFEPNLPGSGRWSVIADQSITQGDSIRAMIEEGPGHVWIATENQGLLEFNDGQWQWHDIGDGFGAGSDLFAKGPDGRLLASSDHHVWRLNGSAWEILYSPPEGTTCLGVSSNGNAYIGLTSGLARVVDGNLLRMPLGQEIGAPHVTSLLASKSNMLWVGTQQGLVHGVLPSWKSYAEYVAENLNIGTALAAEASGDMIVMDDQGDVFGFELATQAFERIEMQRPDVGSVQWLTRDPDGTYWYLTTTHLVHFDPRQKAVLSQLPLPESSDASRLYLDSKGNKYIYGGRTFQTTTGDHWRVAFDGLSSIENRVTCMVENADGSFYVGTDWGAYHCQGGQAIPLESIYPVAKDVHFKSAFLAKDGSSWLGTYGSGLLVIADGGVRQITRKDGLLSDHISAIYEASDGTMWIGYRRKGVGSFKDGLWLNYSSEDGLPNGSVETVCEFPAGSIWAGTSRFGLYRFEPDAAAPETEFLGFPSEIHHRGTAVYSFAGRDAWNRQLTSKLVFSWRLVSLDGDDREVPWSPFTSKSTIVLSDLNPGRYYFEVRASDGDRNVDSTPSAQLLEVHPPLWFTPEFLVPVSLLSVMVVISLGIGMGKHIALLNSQRLLTDSERSLAEAQRIAHLGHWVWDVGTGEVTCSNELLRILGLSRKSSPTTSDTFLGAVHAEDRLQVEEAVNTSIRKGNPIRVDHRVIQPNGEQRFVQTQGEAIVDAEGQVVRFQGTVLDVTERKRAEDEREKLIQDLRLALSQVRTLRGLLPICTSCKRIRDDKGYWEQVEVYFRDHTEIDFSHSICPECVKRLYPTLYKAD